MKSSVHVSLDNHMLEKFNDLSHRANKSRNQIISELVLEWMEDYEDYLLAEQAIQEIKDGKDELISHEEFKAKLKEINND